MWYKNNTPLACSLARKTDSDCICCGAIELLNVETGLLLREGVRTLSTLEFPPHASLLLKFVTTAPYIGTP